MKTDDKQLDVYKEAALQTQAREHRCGVRRVCRVTELQMPYGTVQVITKEKKAS